MSSNATAGKPIQGPTDLTRADFKAVLRRTVKEVKQDDVPGLAAGVAFKIFLALFPSLIAAVAVFGLVTDPVELREALSKLAAVVPRSAFDVIDEQLRTLTTADENKAGLTAALGVAAGVFAATSAAVSLMKALSRAYDVAETRTFLKQRLLGLVLILGLLAALVMLVVLLVAGPQLQEALLPDFVAPVDVLLALARALLALLVLIALFAFVYWAGPNRDRPAWEWMSPGALLGVIGWLAVAGGFTLYVQTAGNYNATYGTFAGVAVLLLWLQLSMLAMLFGAEFNAEVERTRGAYARGDERLAPGLAEQTAADKPAAKPGAPPAATPPAPPTAAPPVPVPIATAPSAAPATPPPIADIDAFPPGSPVVIAHGPRRRTGAVVAGLMTVAVFLGFARRRRR